MKLFTLLFLVAPTLAFASGGAAPAKYDPTDETPAPTLSRAYAIQCTGASAKGETIQVLASFGSPTDEVYSLVLGVSKIVDGKTISISSEKSAFVQKVDADAGTEIDMVISQDGKSTLKLNTSGDKMSGEYTGSIDGQGAILKAMTCEITINNNVSGQ